MLSQHVPSASSTAFSNSFCSYMCTCSVTSEPQVGITRRQCLLITHSCRPLNKARLQPRHRLSKSAKYANKASASNSQGAAASLTVRSPAASDQQHDPQHTGSSELFTPLTKAHKPAKAAAANFTPIRLQQAGRAAAIAALAVGAGAAMTALAVDVTDAAITGAVLAAGAVVLPSTGAEFAQHIVHGVTESNWEDEEDDEEDPANLQISDAEWAHTAKLIEERPCQVQLEDAFEFAYQFNPNQKLPGETTSGVIVQIPPQEQAESARLQAAADEAFSAEQARREEWLSKVLPQINGVCQTANLGSQRSLYD